MPVKIMRSIFRLDYQLSYRLLDQLGAQLEEIITRTKEPPFEKVKGNIETAKRAIRAQGEVGEGNFELNLTLNSFDGVVEKKDGYEINQFHKNPVFDLANDIIQNLNLKADDRYERIGFRSFLLITGDDVKFQPALEYFKKLNQPLVDLVSSKFSSVDDVGITLESYSEELGNIRLALGPYGERDKGKFFSADSGEDEGLIVDIDWWETKMRIPSFKLSGTVKNCQEIYDKIVKNVGKTIF